MSYSNSDTCPPDQMRMDCTTSVTASYVLETECVAPCRLIEPMTPDETTCGLTECMCP